MENRLDAREREDWVTEYDGIRGCSGRGSVEYDRSNGVAHRMDAGVLLADREKAADI